MLTIKPCSESWGRVSDCDLYRNAFFFSRAAGSSVLRACVGAMCSDRLCVLTRSITEH